MANLKCRVDKYESREEWLAAREGRITGSIVKDLISRSGPTVEMIKRKLDVAGVEYKKTAKKEELEALLSVEARKDLQRELPKKAGFYKLIALRTCLDPGEEWPMDRGNDLEEEALVKFGVLSGKEVTNNLVIWSRKDNESIAISPDGEISNTEAVEVKCLASWKHIKSFLTKEIPEEYLEQAIQYFVVNDLLKTLYFVMYDPRFPKGEIFWITLERKGLQEMIEKYLEIETEELQEIDEIVNKLTF